MDAAAEEALLGKFLDKNDFCGDEDGGLAVLVGHSDFDEGLFIVGLAAGEADSALGHVLAGDDIVATCLMADAGGVIDFDARVLAAIDSGRVWFFRGGHGEDRRFRLVLNGRLRRRRELLGSVRLSVERRRRCCGNRWNSADGRRLGTGIWRRRGDFLRLAHGEAKRIAAIARNPRKRILEC